MRVGEGEGREWEVPCMKMRGRCLYFRTPCKQSRDAAINDSYTYHIAGIFQGIKFS